MAVRIRVKNFQSIADATIEVKGLTIVTGINNSGKSALVRAIRGVFQNTKGESFVRYGQKTASVQMDFEDGKSVQWEKGKDIRPTYIVCGGEPIYPGQGVPDEVKALGVGSIQAGGREIWPQIAPQFEQVFLLNQPGSVLAEAVADVDRVKALNEALRGVESDRRTTAAELKIRQKDVLRHKQRLDDFAGLDEAEAQIIEIESRREKVILVSKAIEGLKGLFLRMQKATQTVHNLEGIETIGVPPDEDFTPLHNLRKERGELAVLLARKQKAQQSINNFTGLESVHLELDSMQVERFLAAIGLAEGLLKRRQVAELQIRGIEQEQEGLERELTAVTDSIKELLGNYSECPLCGSALGQHEHGESVCPEVT